MATASSREIQSAISASQRHNVGGLPLDDPQHMRPPSFQRVALLVGERVSLINPDDTAEATGGMVQYLLDDGQIYIPRRAMPVASRAAQVVERPIIDPCRTPRQWRPLLLRTPQIGDLPVVVKRISRPATLRNALDDLDGMGAQWHLVALVVLHPPSGQLPKLLLQVDLGPRHAGHLIQPLSG